MAKPISVKPDDRKPPLFHQRFGEFQLGGWYDGKRTYLWFGGGGACLGTLSGQKLYRMAKAIVRQFEEPKGQGT